jgi:hypothetical protein
MNEDMNARFRTLVCSLIPTRTPGFKTAESFVDDLVAAEVAEEFAEAAFKPAEEALAEAVADCTPRTTPGSLRAPPGSSR